MLLFHEFLGARCSKIFTKISVVVSEVGSALSSLMEKGEGTGTGTLSALPRKQYLLGMGHGDQPWDFAYIADMENKGHGPEMTYLMSRPTLLIVCFFHWVGHHSISALPRSTGNPRASSWRGIFVHNKDPWVHLDPNSNPEFGSRWGIQTKGFKWRGSSPRLLSLQLANFSQTPGFPIQLLMTLQTNSNLHTGLSTTGKCKL